VSTTQSTRVDHYLRRLQAALAGLPADRRREIIEGFSQHISDARLQPGHDSDEAIRSILGQLGDPEVIAAEALDAERVCVAAGGPPPPVRNAAWLMYTGAAVSLAAAIAAIATRSGLREVIARTPISRNLIGTAATATIVQAAAVNLAAVVVWLLMVRWNRKRQHDGADPRKRAFRPPHGSGSHRAWGTVRAQPLAGGRASACRCQLARRPGRDGVLVAEKLDRLHQGQGPLVRLLKAARACP
jgi:uncharacterized membrane protein